MMSKKFLRQFNGFDHGPGGNGGAGKLIKNTAVFFHSPVFFAYVGQAFIVKLQYPVGFFKIDFIVLR